VLLREPSRPRARALRARRGAGSPRLPAPEAPSPPGGAGSRREPVRRGLLRVPDGELRYETDYYRGFVAGPDRLLTGEAVRYLAEARVADSVVEVRIDADGAAELDASVLELYGDYRDASRPRAVVRARFLLLEDTAEATHVTADWTLGAEVPLPGPGAPELARGLGAAWGSVLAQLAEKLAAPPP